MPVIRVPIGLDGPVIDLGIWLARALAHAFVARGQVAPPPQTIRALVDTGADGTAIHPKALALIASPPSGTTLVRRPGSTTNARRVNLHDVRLAFGGAVVSPTKGSWVEIESVAVIPADPGVLALIGRDMLAHCQFVYDGLKGELLLIC
jgi:predicted aspartyl protease